MPACNKYLIYLGFMLSETSTVPEVLPNSCGSSWQKTATDVLRPLDSPSVKAAPAEQQDKIYKQSSLLL